MTLSEALLCDEAVVAANKAYFKIGAGMKDALSAAVLVAERMVGEGYSDAELRDRVKWLESLFSFSDPEIVLNSAPNDPVTKDAVVVLREHYESTHRDHKLREALVRARNDAIEEVAREIESIKPAAGEPPLSQDYIEAIEDAAAIIRALSHAPEVK